MSCATKLCVLLCVLCVPGKVVDKLLSENKQLRSSNSILQKQLLQFAQLAKTNITSEVSEDAAYNAQKLSALISEFDSEEEAGAQALIAEEMLDYLRALAEDANLLGGAIGEVSSEEISTAMQELKQGIEVMKDGEQRREFSRLYDQLKALLDHKEEVIRGLQLENAKLTGQLDAKIAELHNLQQSSEHDQMRLQDALERLKSLEEAQSDQFESLKFAIQREEEISRQQARDEFLTIQISQDTIISDLQSKVNDYVSLLEAASVEKATLLSKQRVQENAVERLKNELVARTNQLTTAQEKFDQFTAQLEENNRDESSFLRQAEE